MQQPRITWFTSAAVRSFLSEFAGEGLTVVRDCQFSFAAKVLTPVDDILVPLMRADALDDIYSREGIAGVIANPSLAASVPDGLGLAVADEPLVAHHRIHLRLAQTVGRLWKDFPTEIGEGAQIHPTAWIAPKNVRIGQNVVMMPGAVVHERSVIGAGTRLHSHAVIGSDAYEIILVGGKQMLRPQTGGVIVGAQCEIMAGTVVTRSAFCGATTIGDHSVLDCNVVVSHDCRLGSNVRVGGGAWLGGRVTVESAASLGPNCAIGNGLHIGERANVAIGAVVTRDVGDDTKVSGNFAIDHDRMIEHMRRIR